MVNASICKIGDIGSNPISSSKFILKLMTARLTNAIGTRLGISHSWKKKSIINTKTHFLSLFKREQQYNQYMLSLFNKKAFKKQSIIPGSPIKYYNNNNKVTLDLFLYDTAYERTRFNIKSLRRLTAFIKKQRNPYYRSPNMEQLRENKIKETNILEKIMTKSRRSYVKSVNIAQKYSLKTKHTKLLKIILARNLIMKYKIKTQIHSEIFRQKLNKIAKLVIYYFARGLYFQAHALRVIQRIMQKQRISYNHLNVNLISIPKVYITITMIMNFIIKRLYLNYNLLETLKPFKKYLKLRTAGYILRGCGRLTKKQRAWYVKRHKGKTKINNLTEYVTYKYKNADLKYGTVGVKLWLNY